MGVIRIKDKFAAFCYVCGDHVVEEGTQEIKYFDDAHEALEEALQKDWVESKGFWYCEECARDTFSKEELKKLYNREEL